MSIKLRPPEGQLLTLLEISSIGNQRLTELVSHLEGLSELPLQPLRLAQECETVLSPEEAERAVAQLLSLHGLTRKANVSATEIAAAITQALQSHPDHDHNQWADVVNVMVQLIEAKAVRITSAAIDLSYDYANLVRQTRILSDIRPLYDKPGKNIEAAVVSHTLRLHYDTADGNHELSLALDGRDIRDLIEQCERALLKAETARDLLETKAGIPAVVSGETTEEEK